jgi:hypothetical protein
MSDDTPMSATSSEAARLAVGWEIVRASELDKRDPVHVANVLSQVIQILKRAEARQPKMEGDITVHPVSPKDSTASPGATLRLTYNFTGGPASIPLVVFVHFYAVGGDGSPVWGDDHDPPTPTTAWSGATTYMREITIPANAPPGAYRIGIGLYDSNGIGERLEMRTSGGASSGGGKRYDVGTLKLG